MPLARRKPPIGKGIVIIQIESSVNAVSKTLYFSSGVFNPAPSNHPRTGASVEPFFNPVISGLPKIGFKMGCHTWGTDTESTFGSVDLTNTDNELDFLLAWESKGLNAWVYLGDPELTFNDFRLVATLKQEKFVLAGERIVRLSFLDELAAVRESIQKTFFPTTTPNPVIEETPMPKLYGKCLSTPPAVYDKNNEIYQTGDVAALASYQKVYDTGIVLPVGAGPAKYTITPTGDTTLAAITLGSNSSGKILVDATGDAATGNKLDTIVTKILETDNSISMTAGEKTALGVDTEAVDFNMGVYISENVTSDIVLKKILDTFNAWMYQNIDGTKSIGFPRESVGNPDAFVEHDNAFGDFLKISDDAPGLTTTMGVDKNWHVSAIETLAAAVPETTKQKLSNTHRLYYEAADSVHSNYAHAERACPLDSVMASGKVTDDITSRKVANYGGRRWFYSVTAALDILEASQLEPGDIIALSIEDFGLVDPYDIDVHVNPLATSGFFFDENVSWNASGGNVGSPAPVIEDNLSVVQFTGNNWFTLAYRYEITENTLLEFDFKAITGAGEIEGEIIGLGVCTVANPTEGAEATTYFQIHGTQTAGVQTYNNLYTNNSGWKRYKIPIGTHFTGVFGWLRFVADHDAYTAFSKQNSRFRNVRLREDGFLHTQLIGAEKELGDAKVKLLTWGG